MEDAADLFALTRHSRVGPIAGWPPHGSVTMSRAVIRDELSAPETFALVLKETGKPVGCVGLMAGEQSNLEIGADEGELGFWLGVPFRGAGAHPRGRGRAHTGTHLR